MVPPDAAERESWERLTDGDEAIADVGAHPVAPGAGAEFYERTGAATAVDVNMIERGGAAHDRARRGARRT